MITKIYLSRIAENNPETVLGVDNYWYKVQFDNQNYLYSMTMSHECAYKLANVANIEITKEQA